MYSSEDLEFLIVGIDTEIEKVNNEIEKLREEKLKPLNVRRDEVMKLIKKDLEKKIFDKLRNEINEKLEKRKISLSNVQNNTKLSEVEKNKKIEDLKEKIKNLESQLNEMNK